MRPVELTFFAIALYLALTGLIKWKIRRDEVSRRLNRGLKGYVAAKSRPSPSVQMESGEADNEDLIVA